MASFKDKLGREWLVEPTISVCRRLKSRAEHPIDVLDPKSLANAFDDPYLRFDLLWAFCEAQAQQVSVSVDDFDKAIATEEAFTESAKALRGSLTDFFLRVGMASLAAVIAETIAARERLDRLSLSKINGPRREKLFDAAVAKADAEMDALFDKAEAKLLQTNPPTDGSNSTSSPGSSV